jgi:hypothetical protein
MANSVSAILVVMVQPKQTISKVAKSTRFYGRGGTPLARDLSRKSRIHKSPKVKIFALDLRWTVDGKQITFVHHDLRVMTTISGNLQRYQMLFILQSKQRRRGERTKASTSIEAA